MKKLILLFIVFLFICCSSDSSDNVITPQPTVVNKDEVLLKRIVETINGYTTTQNFVYDGKKLLSVNKSNGDQKIFTYSNDLITEVYWSGAQRREKFEYNDQRQLIRKTIISWSQYPDPPPYTIEFTHHIDGTISYNYTQPPYPFFPTSGTIDSKDMIQEEVSDVYYYPSTGNHGVMICSGGTRFNTLKYYYDNRYNPLRNIVGFKEIFFAGVTDYQGSLEHNLRVKYSRSDAVVDDFPEKSCSGGNEKQVGFTYYASGFPKTSYYNFDNTIGTNDVYREYFYE